MYLKILCLLFVVYLFESYYMPHKKNRVSLSDTGYAAVHFIHLDSLTKKRKKNVATDNKIINCASGSFRS